MRRIAAGVDIKTIVVRLGHSSTKLPLDTYGHPMGTDAERSATDRVDRAPSGAPQAPARAGPQATAGAGRDGKHLTCTDARCPGQHRPERPVDAPARGMRRVYRVKASSDGVCHGMFEL
jgi:hypothetical protein